MTGISLRGFRDDASLNEFCKIKLVAELGVESAHIFFRSIHRKTDMAQGLNRPLGKSDIEAVLINHRGNGFGIGTVRNGLVGQSTHLGTEPVIVKFIGRFGNGH